MPPWPGRAASPPSSPSSTCGERPSATGLLVTRGERGEVMGISEVSHNTLFGEMKGKFAAINFGISVSPVSGKTTGEGVDLDELSKVKGRDETVCGTGQGFSRPPANHPRGIITISKNIPKPKEDQ